MQESEKTLNEKISTNIHLEPVDNERLANLCGQHNQHIQQVARHLDVSISNRGHLFQINGIKPQVDAASIVLNKLYSDTKTPGFLTPEKIHLTLQGEKADKAKNHSNGAEIVYYNKSGTVKPYTDNQKQYLLNIQKYDINFCIGPAGTGKTYLAVACAVDALEKEQVQRILLVRPAVEAGEKLGFLPGDLSQKIEPYLRPLYDALFAMLGFEKVETYITKGIIEIAPLAYMRGRTLNDSFVILDESQNTTLEQMKMFLTRIGFGTKAIITGDVTQIDLPRGKLSGLIQAKQILQNIDGISFTEFNAKDVVRHTLVQRIIEAYEAHEKEKNLPNEH